MLEGRVREGRIGISALLSLALSSHKWEEREQY